MPLTQSDALRNLPPYVFAELDRLKADARARGATLVDLGIGSPNIPVAPGIIRAMAAAGEEPTSGAYPPFRATPGYFEAIVDFMHSRFGATIEPETEALALSGAKEGIAQLIFALCGPGDVVLVPEIFYPVFARAPLLCGAEVRWVPMRAADRLRLDLDAISATDRKRAKILIANYPNNPTGARVEVDFHERAVAFAQQNDLLLRERHGVQRAHLRRTARAERARGGPGSRGHARVPLVLQDVQHGGHADRLRRRQPRRRWRRSRPIARTSATARRP